MSDITKFDNENIYCRKLGHHVPFKYCRIEKLELPCVKILDCWFKKIKIKDFLKENYSEKDLEYLFKASAPTPKITSLIELIEQAKKVNKKQ